MFKGHLTRRVTLGNLVYDVIVVVVVVGGPNIMTKRILCYVLDALVTHHSVKPTWFRTYCICGRR